MTLCRCDKNNEINIQYLISHGSFAMRIKGNIHRAANSSDAFDC